jgi:type IV secretory pathway VirB2 component (pilin)
MLHPLFSTIIHRPDLLAEHVSAYAELVQQEASSVGTDLLQRGVAWVIAGISALLFLIFTGIALMLGLVINQFHWILVAVPGVMLVLTLLAYFRAKTAIPQERFRELKAQLASDAQALRTAA